MSQDRQFVNELHRSAFDLGFDLAQAIAGYELYSSAAKGNRWGDISERHLNRPATAIGAILKSNTILVIGRLWDKDERSHSVDRLLDLLEHPAVDSLYGPATEKKTFSRQALADLKERARKARNDPQFISVARVRNKHVAHHDVFDPKQPVPKNFRPMEADDEMAVIDLTASIILEAAAMVGCTLMTVAELREMWAAEGTRFWDGLSGSS